MPKAPKTETSGPASFEDALAELETLVVRMEDGELPLEASLTAYKRGAELLQYCQARLKDAQQQIKVLDGDALQDFNLDNEQ
jgi:exodeoxyribonuclease VII small subunit